MDGEDRETHETWIWGTTERPLFQESSNLDSLSGSVPALGEEGEKIHVKMPTVYYHIGFISISQKSCRSREGR